MYGTSAIFSTVALLHTTSTSVCAELGQMSVCVCVCISVEGVQMAIIIWYCVHNKTTTSEYTRYPYGLVYDSQQLVVAIISACIYPTFNTNHSFFVCFVVLLHFILELLAFESDSEIRYTWTKRREREREWVKDTANHNKVKKNTFKKEKSLRKTGHKLYLFSARFLST